MSALGIVRPTFDSVPAASGRVALVIASLVAIGFAGRVGTGMHDVSAPPVEAVAANHGPFSAVGLAARPHAADPIADFIRHGLGPDARSPKRWVPDAIGSLDICRLPRGDVSWASAATRNPLTRHAAGSRRARATRRHERARALDGIATLDGTLRFQLASGFQTANGYKAPATAISAFEALPPLDIGELDVSGAIQDGVVHGLGNPTADAENRRAATIGTAANVLRFDDRPGRLSTAAQAGLWNGTPATAIGVGYTLPNRIRLDATGVTNVNAWTNVGKTFEVSTVASIPLN